MESNTLTVEAVQKITLEISLLAWDTLTILYTCNSPSVSSSKSAKTITINPYTRLLQVFDTGCKIINNVIKA